MRVIGHRGAAGHAPENTLLSVEIALRLGAPWVEVDVRTSSDGVPVIIHDENLERTTGVAGSVAGFPLEFLRGLDAGKGEKIPLAREVLDLLRGRAGLNLEIKDAGAVAPLCDLLRQALAGGWRRSDLLVSSFDAAILESSRRALPDIPLGLLDDSGGAGSVGRAKRLGAVSVGFPASAFRVEWADACHREGLEALAFTANRPEEVLRLERMGVDGIFTDFPDRALEVLAVGSSPGASAGPGAPVGGS